MCKQIETDMVLYYALAKNDSISSQHLVSLHQQLLNQIQGVLVDTTLSSIQEVVNEQGNLFELSQCHKSFTIAKRQKPSNFFKEEFLDRCYSPFYQKEEFSKIKEILMQTINVIVK